jgi:hypothetical protein
VMLATSISGFARRRRDVPRSQRQILVWETDSESRRQIPNCWIHRWGSPAQVCEAHVC